jgi:hypothetical protein
VAVPYSGCVGFRSTPLAQLFAAAAAARTSCDYLAELPGADAGLAADG